MSALWPTGLGSTPLFLIGTLALEDSLLVARQYLARDYAEERAVIALFAESLRDRRLLVTFNGKSFDLPYVRVRSSYHRAPALPELPHFDVLLEARRIWRSRVPNCRLKTLEELICGRLRDGDIDGADIPEAYHRFVRSGDAAELSLIVRHNRLDLLTMAELLLRMPPVVHGPDPHDDKPYRPLFLPPTPTKDITVFAAGNQDLLKMVVHPDGSSVPLHHEFVNCI